MLLRPSASFIAAVGALIASAASGGTPTKPHPLDKAPRPFVGVFVLPDGIAAADFTDLTGEGDNDQTGLAAYVSFGESGSTQIFASCREVSPKPTGPSELAQIGCDNRVFHLVRARGSVEVREGDGPKPRILVRLPVPEALTVKSWDAVLKSLPREPRKLDPEPKVLPISPALPAGTIKATFSLNTGGDQWTLRQVGLSVAVVYGDKLMSQTFASCNTAGHGDVMATRDDLDAADCDAREFHLRQRKNAIEVVETGEKVIVSIPIPDGVARPWSEH